MIQYPQIIPSLKFKYKILPPKKKFRHKRNYYRENSNVQDVITYNLQKHVEAVQFAEETQNGRQLHQKIRLSAIQ